MDRGWEMSHSDTSAAVVRSPLCASGLHAASVRPPTSAGEKSGRDLQASSVENDSPISVLIADDDALIVATIGESLRRAGYKVTEAFDGAAALQICQSQKPSIAIIDHSMPTMSGLELARRVSEDGDVAVIFLSAYNDELIIRDAISAGAMCYLVKPIDTDKLLPVIQTAFERSRELISLRRQTEQLAAALQMGRNISIAVGLIMEKLQVCQGEALDRLRLHARTNRRRLEEVALDLLKLNDESARAFNALRTKQ